MGELQPDGSWKADPGSPFRSLTVQEVKDLREMAKNTTPSFSNVVKEVVHNGKKHLIEEHNASWEEHHPVAREVWKKRGVKH